MVAASLDFLCSENAVLQLANRVRHLRTPRRLLDDADTLVPPGAERPGAVRAPTGALAAGHGGAGRALPRWHAAPSLPGLRCRRRRHRSGSQRRLPPLGLARDASPRRTRAPTGPVRVPLPPVHVSARRRSRPFSRRACSTRAVARATPASSARPSRASSPGPPSTTWRCSRARAGTSEECPSRSASRRCVTPSSGLRPWAAACVASRPSTTGLSSLRVFGACLDEVERTELLQPGVQRDAPAKART